MAIKVYLNNIDNADLIVAFVSITFADSPYTSSWGEDVSVDCTNGEVTVNLPTAVGNGGKTLWVTKSDVSANQIVNDGNGTETINGQLTKNIRYQYTSLTLRSDTANVVIR